ncbi:putative NAD{FAD}-dependent dehydrogenase [Geoglobus ahangari]|uniref:Putative NAD(FAD)-dependent dehydrogenase n=1 Tax=Geoglobus ahangari TaxID=113653 RepID=A0A0F7IFC9_9EURY|nr:FAD/NAD(P)-binding oxidoreductase [Geoglobus ahangari]AKG91504.1 putative NAD{FAD}-dependent dehydrogenase [Geoglobus ahangari]NOY11208.1 NAD(P)/FAD-dependent oxidoreductase [Archaeoglobi archaeon]
MKRIVILGGGVAGTLTANYLVPKIRGEIRDGNVEVTLITDRPYQVYEPGFLYLIFNRLGEAELKRDIRELLDPAVNIVIDRATKIEAENNRVVTENGVYDYDYLVIATGARVVPEEIPGLKEGGHWFYNFEGAVRLREALAKFTGGKVVVSVMGVPHKCPVAPMEVSFILHDFLKRRNLRDKSEILYTYPINKIFTMDPVVEMIQPMFDERGIQYKTFFNPLEVDAKNKKIITLEGEEESYDLLIAIPPHRGAKVVEDSGLGDKGGWVPTDRYTLKVEGYENMYALGDATNLPVSKAGSVAHFQAEVVAENLAAEIEGIEPTAMFNGKAFCFIETGWEEATYIWFDYYTPPQPVMPSKFVHFVKMAYNKAYWLTARGLL